MIHGGTKPKSGDPWSPVFLRALLSPRFPD
jgi:hypothetical protein